MRLIAPGWFGIANAKWLRRIEVRDTRFMGRFMARDYVTVREESRDGETVVEQTSVGRCLAQVRTGQRSRAQTAVTESRVWRGSRRRSPQSK